MNSVGRPSKKPRSSLGKRITQARRNAGLSQVQLAEKLGLPQQVVAAWERKAITVRSDNLIKLCEALSVSADELLGTKPMDNKGPTGKAKQAFEDVLKLSRRQQEKIVDVVKAFVEMRSNGEE